MSHLTGIEVASLWAAIETAAELSQLGIYVARVDASPPTIVYVSPRAAIICGRSEDDLRGQLPWAILDAADWPQVQQAIARPAGAAPRAFTVTVVQPSGERIPIELASTRIVTAKGTFVLGYFRDVSAERDAIAALRASEARFRFLVQAAPDGVVILVRGIVVFMNPKAAALLLDGTPEQAIGKPIASFQPEDDARITAERIMEMLRSGKEMPPNEYRTLVDPARIIEIKSVPCDWEGKPAVLAFARDVTERKAIQQRLVEADRLAAMGTLAAGVAHEINNPLTYAMLGVQRIESLLGEVPAGAAAAIRERLGDIEHGLSRVASITQGLRSFARPADTAQGPVDLAATVERALKMVDNDLRHRAQLIKHLTEVPPVVGNASRLEQVIVNIVLNALHALPADGPQTITLTLRPRDEATVTLAIQDTGRGIPDDIVGKIFDPFFTTRTVGDGMGLGLAVCKTIVEGVGGAIEVASTVGTGTTMTIVLPAHRGTAKVVPPPVQTRTAVRRKILLIDDERLVRDALARLLGSEHEVVAVGNGADGLAALRAGSFDAIVCDVMMPGMNGWDVYRRIAAEFPGLERRVVFISGGTFTSELDEFLRTTANRCLSKPFKLDDLFKAIDATCADRGTAL